MEPSGATSGNQWRMRKTRTPQKQAETVAMGCDRLPQGPHGKEGVDGSSPSEGSAKPVLRAGFAFRRSCTSSSVRCREDAYVLSSLTVDLKISEIVGAGQYVVSALLPLAIFRD
jgi:hypothetical protein